jgi:FKBP-type peptidyl-prolyl cis-trans isomerase SlyD
MQISENKVVTIDYTLKDDDGNILDSSQGGPGLAYLHGAQISFPDWKTPSPASNRGIH